MTLSNKTLIVLLLFVFISCGKNAQIEVNSSDRVNIVKPVTGEEFLALESKKIDLGKVLINQSISKETTIENISNQNVSITNFSSEQNFVITDNQCFKILAPKEKCSVRVQFSPLEVKNYQSNITVSFEVADAKKSSIALLTLGEGINKNLPTRDLNPGYNQLNADKYDFGELGLGSTYTKLIYLQNKGSEAVTLDDIRSAFPNEVSVLKELTKEGSCFYKTELAAGDECYLSVVIAPTSLGSKSNYFYVDYSPLNNRESKTLPINLSYQVVNSNECLRAEEKVYLTKNANELTPYELNLEFPYKFRTSNGAITLRRVLNTGHTDIRSHLENHDIFYVTDAQVFFSFGLRLTPNRNIIGTRVLLDAFKSGAFTGPHFDTELLCNNDMKRCSGKYFVDPNMTDLITNRFTIMSKFFSDMFFKIPVVRNEFIYFSESFGLNKYLHMKNSSIEDLVNNNSSLSFTVTDDIKLNRTPKLLVNESEVVTCIR